MPQDPSQAYGSGVASTIEEGQLRIDGVGVFYRRVGGEGTPVVYCHGNPISKRKLVVHDWGGLALIGAQRRPELIESSS
jgi:hypothetical protein